MTSIHPAVYTSVTNSFYAVLQLIRIVIIRIGVFCHRTEGELVGEVLFIAKERTDIAKGAEFHLCREMRSRVCCGQTKCLNIQDGRHRRLTGGNEDIIIITNHQ